MGGRPRGVLPVVMVGRTLEPLYPPRLLHPEARRWEPVLQRGRGVVMVAASDSCRTLEGCQCVEGAS